MTWLVTRLKALLIINDNPLKIFDFFGILL
jgi:hypothetical protein